MTGAAPLLQVDGLQAFYGDAQALFGEMDDGIGRQMGQQGAERFVVLGQIEFGEIERPPARRQVSSGSSAITVSTPTRTASISFRQRCTSRRAGAPVIHRDAPVRVAMRPSAEAASFSRTNGRPVTTCRANDAISSCAASPSTPVVTAIPARRSWARPRRLTTGFGSMAPITTRFTPDAITCGAHGGIRPWCVHGSSVK